MSNAYEIRHSILSQAQDMLMEEWRRECDRSPREKKIPLPTAERIKALAEELYDFVQQSSGKPREVKRP
jgi:hypothetical protein